MTITLSKTYIGTKVLRAAPLSRGAYNDYRGWETPANENPNDAGYLVEYMDGGPSNHAMHENYISWSPKEVFEAAYQPDTAMSFGAALVLLKAGAKVARKGWNGKGMWIALTPGGDFPVHAAKRGHAAAHRADEMTSGDDRITLLPHIDMRAADGSMVVGWLASQSDLLAEDWTVVEDELRPE